MDESERAHQQQLHDTIEEILREGGELSEGQVLTSWIVCYELESMSSEKAASAGHFYGPHEMKTWRALGLLEWVRRFSLRPDDDDEDDRDA